MKHSFRLALALSAVCTSGLLLNFCLPALEARAQPITSRMLRRVTVSPSNDCPVLTVSFNFPVRYVTHAPPEQGTDLRIQLEPIALSPVDRDDSLRREAVGLPAGSELAVDSIYWEGDDPSGPWLTLEFSGNTRFAVKQGTDFRSIQVALPGPEASCPGYR